jgi:hypothetical protein
MIRRRHILAGAAAMTCLRAACRAAEPGPAAGGLPAGVPAGGSLAFRASRNGCEIGSHTLSFHRSGGALTVRIEASFRVHFGPITFYRYHHQATEQWRDGQFVALDTQTDDNGSAFEVHAARGAGGVLIRATNMADQLAPPDALPLTHWAVADTSARLFNPQDGKLLAETLQGRGACTVTLADGVRIPATRFALAGPAPIDDYYDAGKLWAALDAVGRDGSRITYRRL